METRASYLLIGAFVLAVIAGVFGFVIWLAKVEIDREFAYYDVYFTGSVAGLALGGDVRYRGIRVGSVNDISIDSDDPGRVRVLIEVGAETRIREGDEAQLNSQGITGVSYVNIEGAVSDSPVLVAKQNEPRPVIASKPSALEQLFEGAPDLLTRAAEVTDRLARFLSEENSAAVTSILVDMKTLSGSLASRSDQFGRIIDTADRLGVELELTARSTRQIAERLDTVAGEASGLLTDLRSVTGKADRLMQGDLRRMVADVSAAADKIGAASDSVDALFEENRVPLQNFTSDGLNQFTKFLTEASILVGSMTRLTDRLDAEGARFLLGTQESEYKLENQ